MPSPLEAALRRVPDRPEWVDTRGMLLTGRAEVHFASPADLAQGGFVVCLASRALMSVVGEPPARLVADAAARLTGDVNVLCPASQAAGVKEALPDWRRQSAIIHALQADPVDDGSDPENVRVFTATNAPSLAHVPETLRAELTDALAGRPTIRFVHGEVPPVGAADLSPAPIPIAAAWIGGAPVAFCYPVLQTETLWDVSVDTLEGHRGLGLAGIVARAMIRHMRGVGKAPVWGALETNGSSLSVARRLGFREAGRLSVFTCR